MARRCAEAGRPLDELFSAPEEELGFLELRPARLTALRAAPPADPVLLDALAAAGATLLPCTDPRWPAGLSTARGYDPPPVLTCAGDLSLLARPGVAIVGSREPRAERLAYARDLAAGLVAAGRVVVSGNARGIDRAAHAGAAGATIGVIPSGLLQHAPNPDLGLVLSPFAPYTLVSSHTPLVRNALITALAEVVVVVEARTVGGTWHAAGRALAQGRPLATPPGPGGSGNAELLRRGATELPTDAAAAVALLETQRAEAPPPPADELELPGL